MSRPYLANRRHETSTYRGVRGAPHHLHAMRPSTRLRVRAICQKESRQSLGFVFRQKDAKQANPCLESTNAWQPRQ
jgi:hypothetical protein